MSDFSIDLNVKGAQDTLEQWTIDVISRFAWGLHLLAEDAMTLAKVLVPVRTGYLRSTGRVEQPEVDLTSATVSASLGFSASYAAAVHELHASRSKFLEQAMFAVTKDADARLRQWMTQPDSNHQRPPGTPTALPKN